MLEFEGFEERAPRGLQHFRDGAEGFPGELGGDRLDLGGGDDGVFCVAAVEDAAHAPHYCGDDSAFGKGGVRGSDCAAASVAVSSIASTGKSEDSV